MNIPPFDQCVLGDPAFTQARECLAERIQKMPDMYLGENPDEENVILIDECEAWNVFPRLRSKEQGAKIGQLILEIRGHINTDTMSILSYFENEKEDPETIFSCKFPVPLHYSILAMHSLDTEKQKAVYDMAFAHRNRQLQLKYEMYMNDGKQKAATSIGFRARRLEHAYKEVMCAIGAIPSVKPTV